MCIPFQSVESVRIYICIAKKYIVRVHFGHFLCHWKVSNMKHEYVFTTTLEVVKMKFIVAFDYCTGFFLLFCWPCLERQEISGSSSRFPLLPILYRSFCKIWRARVLAAHNFSLMPLGAVKQNIAWPIICFTQRIRAFGTKSSRSARTKVHTLPPFYHLIIVYE